MAKRGTATPRISRLTFAFADDQGMPVNAGRILRWYKDEGDQVDYGDLLFEMQVNEVLLTDHHQEILKKARYFDKRPAGIPEALTSSNGDGRQRPIPVGGEAQTAESWYFFMRVRASDRGTLRRRFSRRRFEAGDVLALFSEPGTETDDLPDAAEADDIPGAAEAMEFKVSTSLMEGDPELPLRAEILETDEATQPVADIPKEESGSNYLLFRVGDHTKRRVGIYLRGDCGLDRVFACRPLIEPKFEGSCCIVHDGTVADARSDLLLQSLEGIPQEWVKPLFGKLNIDPNYVKPTIFEPTFRAYPSGGVEEFPKSVIFLSVGADVTRTLYRHREKGFLVDPGGGWLNEPIGQFLKDLSGLAWFRKTFESVGKMTPEGFRENYAKLIPILKERTNAVIIVFNCSVIEKTSDVHNYQFLPKSDTMRRLQINMALADLSREFDIAVLDVDRIVKRVGIRTMFDWDHAHPKVNLLIAEEALQIMMEREVF